MHGHGLPAAMEGCAGHRPSSERSSRHTQGSVSTCLNRDSCCCRWHQFILPPRIPTALTVFSQEHPQGTSPQCEGISAPLPGPASLLPSPRAFITPWPGAQAKHGASSPLLDGEMQQRQPQHRAPWHSRELRHGPPAPTEGHRAPLRRGAQEGRALLTTSEGSRSSSSSHSTPRRQAHRSVATPGFARRCPPATWEPTVPCAPPGTAASSHPAAAAPPAEPVSLKPPSDNKSGAETSGLAGETWATARKGRSH